MPARAWWYDESDDSRKYAAAARRSRARSRGRRSWSTAFAIIALLVAIVAFSWMHPKTTCSQTMERLADGTVLVHTACRETHSFP